jgi:murein DD-endopeptidase MepM/ murein hydrolase activator NlpD
MRGCAAAIALLALALGASVHAVEIELSGGARGGPLVQRGPLDEFPEAWRAEVRADLDRRVAAMLAEGRIAAAQKAAGVLFAWPVRLVPGAPDAVPNVIANYVDQNAAFPGQVRDWNCGVRSYDLATGYNHHGTDFSAFPFAWLKMDRDEMVVTAAAAGTIIRKDDGAFDQNCGPLASLPPTAQANAIYVRHADGSIAWYLHLKSGSLTPKLVGETVSAGERLASVGSSGFSSGPHLHFEVYSAGGQLIDPYAGTCNTLNPDSWWAQQPAYWQPALVRLSVHTAAPAFGACPAGVAPHATTYLVPGAPFYAAVFLRDFLRNASFPVRVLRPDGTTHFAGTIANTQQDYVASYWYFTLDLPVGSPAGAWRFQADFGGATRETVFQVAAVTPAKATAVEYFHAGFGHYFITAKADEIAGLDAGAYGGVWSRTGRSFPVYASAAAGLVPVCRFFSRPFGTKSSHFYTADPAECAGVKLNPDWTYEEIAFHVPMPDAGGTCPAGSLPVYRMYNNGHTGAPNHRFTTDYATRLAFVPAQDWTQEGAGPVGVGMCAPQ